MFLIEGTFFLGVGIGKAAGGGDLLEENLFADGIEPEPREAAGIGSTQPMIKNLCLGFRIDRIEAISTKKVENFGLELIYRRDKGLIHHLWEKVWAATEH